MHFNDNGNGLCQTGSYSFNLGSSNIIIFNRLHESSSYALSNKKRQSRSGQRHENGCNFEQTMYSGSRLEAINYATCCSEQPAIIRRCSFLTTWVHAFIKLLLLNDISPQLRPNGLLYCHRSEHNAFLNSTGGVPAASAAHINSTSTSNRHSTIEYLCEPFSTFIRKNFPNSASDRRERTRVLIESHK